MLVAEDVGVRIGTTEILRGASVRAERGELVAVVGPNGAGKSTLARAVAGLQRTCAGSVRWDGREIGSLRGRDLARIRAFVPQRSLVPAGTTVRDAVSAGRAPHIRPLAREGAGDRAAIASALEWAGVSELAERQLTTLSGGELQRTQVALALAQECPAVIADEPTSHLDLGAATLMARLLRGLADHGFAVILVVHDLALAAAVADRMHIVAGGTTVAEGPARDVLAPERLADIWGVDAVLEHDAAGSTALRVRWL